MEFSSSLFRLSQSHLTLLGQCPRKFQYTYLEQLALPAVTAEPTAQQLLGTQFHQVMQQQVLGLDVSALLAVSPPLQKWTDAFSQFPPAMIEGERQTEHWRSQISGEYALIAIYDLLIQGSKQAQIVDWKTYRRPMRAQTLAQNWQTRLYLYLLAETSAYAPEQLSMTYWFAEPGETAKGAEQHTLTFHYHQHWHHETAQSLTHILEQLTAWRTAYTQGQPLPQVPPEKGICVYKGKPCRFLEHCERQTAFDAVTEIDLERLALVENMTEISLASLNGNEGFS